MCGILGLYSLTGRPVETELLEGMGDLLSHRGPDDSGVWTSDGVGLGHRRLSVVDLSPRGRNPMPNEDETLWLTANAEIYNYPELRSDLLKKGHRFRSETDTEVILHLYEELGPRCVKELNGMFAFALWDARLKRLLLARDRFGVKPLYYTFFKEDLAFASEIKAFLALPDFKVRLNPFALADHLSFQNTFGEQTFFEGVKLLEAGHLLLCQDGKVEKESYWNLRFHSQSGLSLETWGQGLRERLEAAVKRQLRSDVPLGTYLSGGMDTGSIAAIAAREIPGIHSFTCGFDLPLGASEMERRFDERGAARRLASHLKTTHHELTAGPGEMVSLFPSLIWHLDEPRVGISYQVWSTAELISRFVTVVLSGVGGDELFAGYPWRYEPILGLKPDSFDSIYYRLGCRLLTDEEKSELFTPELNRALGGFSSYESFRSVLEDCEEADPLHRALYFDFKTFLNGLLILEDKLSMAHSVEVRVPFLDNELVDYVSRIPSEFKFQSGQGKVVLRNALEGFLPHEALSRPKQGFTPPDRTWYQGESLAYIQHLILGPRALERGFFRPAALQNIVGDHLNGRRDHRQLIWSLMAFEWWNRIFIDQEIPCQIQI